MARRLMVAALLVRDAADGLMTSDRQGLIELAVMLEHEAARLTAAKPITCVSGIDFDALISAIRRLGAAVDPEMRTVIDVEPSGFDPDEQAAYR